MLYYITGVNGGKEWYVSINDKILSIDVTFDKEYWRKKEISGDTIPSKYIGGYESESKTDYRNLIKLIFSKELIK